MSDDHAFIVQILQFNHKLLFEVDMILLQFWSQWKSYYLYSTTVPDCRKWHNPYNSLCLSITSQNQGKYYFPINFMQHAFLHYQSHSPITNHSIQSPTWNHETCDSVTFYFMKKKSFSDISRKCISPNMIRAINRINLVKTTSC